MVKKETMKLSQSLSRRQLMQLELLVASVVPAVAILVVGIAGTTVNFNYIFFTLDVLICAVAVFFGERSLILRFQHEMDEQLTDLISVCQGFIRGNTDLRASMPGDDRLTQLSSTLNSLFDHSQNLADRLSKETNTHHGDQQNRDIDLLHEQLEQLVEDISPALDGDLRVQSYIVEDTSDESIANIADLCNALVSTLLDFVKWSFFGYDKILNISGDALNSSMKLVKTTERHMQHLSQMITAGEKLVAFLRRIGSDLQFCFDRAEETYLQARKAVIHLEASSEISEKLTTNTQRQIQLLEQIIESIQHATTIAESLTGSLSTLRQQIHQSRTASSNIAENTKAIVIIAEDWFKNAEQLSFPEEE